MNDIKNAPWQAIIAKLRGDSNSHLDAIFGDWLAAAEQNRELFSTLQSVWSDLYAHAAAHDFDEEKAWMKLCERSIDKPRKKQLQRKRFRWAAGTAAAACALFAVLFVTLSEKTAFPTAEVTHSFNNTSGKSLIEMIDGSEVWLHNNTNLNYSNSFNLEHREVALDGEAFFNVADDKDKPFIVTTGELSIKVHGTKFNVRSYKESDMVYVSLLEGSVSLTADGTTDFMKPGQVAVYNKDSKMLQIMEGDPSFDCVWASNRLRIENCSLGEICRYLEKWYNTTIRLDPGIADSGDYNFTISSEPLEEILRIMNRIDPINYRFPDNNVVVIWKGSTR